MLQKSLRGWKTKAFWVQKKNIEWGKSNDLEISKAYIEIDKKWYIYFKKLILAKKVKNYKLKKLWKVLKPYIKMGKNNHKIWWY